VRLIESRDEHARCVFKGGRPKEEKASDACFHEGSRSRSDESDLEAHLGEQPGALGGAIHRRGQVCEKERERARGREKSHQTSPWYRSSADHRPLLSGNRGLLHGILTIVNNRPGVSTMIRANLIIRYRGWLSPCLGCGTNEPTRIILPCIFLLVLSPRANLDSVTPRGRVSHVNELSRVSGRLAR